jgi:hypothetical protein
MLDSSNPRKVNALAEEKYCHGQLILLRSFDRLFRASEAITGASACWSASPLNRP